MNSTSSTLNALLIGVIVVAIMFVAREVLIPLALAGILAYIENTFGLGPLGPNDANAYPFTKAFNYSRAPLRPVPMVHRAVPPGDHIDWAQARQDT